MADVHCPMCGKLNPPELDVCQFCGARLKPILASTPPASKPIQAGDQPIDSGTSELGKAKSSPPDSIHPGEAPTKKNTAELERALPTWLRSLREDKDSAENESKPGASSNEGLPAMPGSTPSSDSSGGLPDWLSGLDKASSDEGEEVPDWLAGLRIDKPDESGPASELEAEPAPELGNPDWMARLGGEPQAANTEPSFSEQPANEAPTIPETTDLTPDWLKSLQPAESSPTEPPVTTPGGENLPDWISGLPGISPESEPALGGADESASMGNLPDWLNQLQDKSTESESTSSVTGAESQPGSGGRGETPSMDNLPDWLNQLQDKSVEPETNPPAARSESIPDWLSGFRSEPATPAPASGENVPDWLSNLEQKSGPEPEMPEAIMGNKSQGATPPGETPSWLSQLQADINAAEETEKHKDDYEVVSEPPAQDKGTGPLPEWLAGIDRTAPTSSGPPALIVEDKGTSSKETGETAFSMEAPDWLSKLKPEQGAEKSTGNEEEQSSTGNLEAAELPSWVQAMRPVESVVAEARTTNNNEDQVTEQSGPLAGLVGVLPTGPGLGALRKPPAYSIKLQISETQQRYVSYFDSLVAGETRPRAAKTARLTSNRIWRWLITFLLLMAVGLPLITNTQVTPSTTSSSLLSDKGAASALIEGIPANAPILIAFDYDPALSGELEAAAAPLIDKLQFKGARLTVVSTSPTGPALAERFLQTTLLVNSHQYHSGEQYVNLGYLAGGPAGISYFAGAPSAAMPYTVNGDPAWATPPLQGVLQLSDFKAVIILTDNADTGRDWIEQSGQNLGQTPMIMVISAQAEPMIRPYFDSGQLKGLVSGLPEAMAYEQSYTRPGLAYHYWDSYNIGMLVAEIIIAIGAAWSAVAAWRARRTNTGEEV